jgi:hypothetical protein
MMSSISAVQAGSQDIVRLIEALRTLSEGLGTTSVVTVDRVLALLTVAHYTNTNAASIRTSWRA